MNKNIIYLLISMLLLSCKVDEFTSFTGRDRLYFHSGSGNLDTQMNHTFVYKKSAIVQDTVWVGVKTMGFPANHSRRFQIKETNNADGIENPNFAQENVHYLPFSNDFTAQNMMIEANEVWTSFPIILLRNEQLKDSVFHLRLEIENTDEFHSGITEKSSFVLSFTDQPIKPNKWALLPFGQYSAVKLYFIVEHSSLILTDEYIERMTRAEKLSYQRYFQKILNGLNSGKPEEQWLKDEKGNIVSFTEEEEN